MRLDRNLHGTALGYLSSGQATADARYDRAMAHHRYARHLLRCGFTGDGKYEMGQALREWRNYRYYLAKVIR